MLRRGTLGLVLRGSLFRSIHVTGYRGNQEKIDKPLALTNDVSEPHEIDEVESSIKERMIFGSIFERMQQKEDLQKKSMERLLDRSGGKNQKDFGEVKVTFGKAHQYVNIEPEDIGIVEYFKKENEKNKKLESTEPEFIQNGEKRGGKSSIIYGLFENIEQTLLQNKKRALDKSDKVTIGNFSPPDTSKKWQSTNLKIDINILEAEERYKAAIDNIMQPYINILQSQIHNDYDILEKIKELIDQFIVRDKAFDFMGNYKPIDIINAIKDSCKENKDVLPQPYIITTPYSILRLLTGSEFEISSDRKYTIAMYVYQKCKTCQDLSLYLNMCNVVFYNLLLELSWNNFRDIHTLLDLTTEMSINGIIGDIETVGLLDSIINGIEDTYDDYIPISGLSDKKSQPVTGVLWTKTTRIDLNNLKKYLNNIKQALTLEK